MLQPQLGPKTTDAVLQNYRLLLERLNAHIQKVEAAFSDQIVCKKGCDACCRFLSLFPVEAFSISHAYSQLPENIKHQINHRLHHHKDACPLLIDHACALYPVRPIICRTHGFPIYIEKNNQVSIDFCPENFKQVITFPEHTLLSIERLNETLIAVNQLFLKSVTPHTHLPDRIPVSQALFILDEF
ncbi:MAG: YkgJ family cysteine cluster protein [Proteobacteria bacterium]|nr:YkgJ family cysteine cluster protein [Pseudomonadota bacterium]MBU1386281.1 YkgJ family cysteine cluster protein [Pseudomonadota bacterium]MBU1542973.1 YkgJ family cysteine cluster protein [Pseudomonadota bacterium]MBU2479996.1 YkgJ family cysteine cluster protein [Pseudomonadota bacterium]